MDEYKKAADLNRDHVMHIAQVLGKFPMKLSDIEDFEGGTDMDKKNLVDYRFGDAYVQVKGMHQGFNTFTLPHPHLRRLQELMDRGEIFPEFHVEIQFNRKGEIRAIGVTKTALLCEIFSSQRKDIPHVLRPNGSRPNAEFFVVEWKHLLALDMMNVIWFQKPPAWANLDNQGDLTQ